MAARAHQRQLLQSRHQTQMGPLTQLWQNQNLLLLMLTAIQVQAVQTQGELKMLRRPPML